MRAEESSLANKQELFSLPVRRFEMLADCEQELLLLKSVWDMISLVKAQVNDWKETLWKDINTDLMEESAKNFSKDLRALPKRAKCVLCLLSSLFFWWFECFLYVSDDVMSVFLCLLPHHSYLCIFV